MFSRLFFIFSLLCVRSAQLIASTSGKQMDDRIHVETDRLKVTIDLVGGDIIGLAFTQEMTSASNPEPLKLLTDEEAFKYLLKSGLVSDCLALSEGAQGRIRYDCARSEYGMQDDQATLTVELNRQLQIAENQSVAVIKTFHFKKGSYVFDVTWSIQNHTNRRIALAAFSQFGFTCGAEKSTLDSKEHLRTPPKVAFYTEVGKYTASTVPSAIQRWKPFSIAAHQGWVALIHQHFLCANLVVQGESQTLYGRMDLMTDSLNVGSQTPVQTVAPGETQHFRSRFFCGPMQRDLLEQTSAHLSLTIDYGLLSFLARPVFSILAGLQKYLKSWGCSIMMLAVLLQGVLLSPLIYRKNKYAVQRKLLEPKLARLRENYGAEPQGLEIAESELLRAHGLLMHDSRIPLGVLNVVFTLLTWPILKNAYELRLTQFFWLPDLTRPDPYRILPVLSMLHFFFADNSGQRAAAARRGSWDQLIGKLITAGVSFFIMKQFAAGVLLYSVSAQSITFVQDSLYQLWFRFFPPRFSP